MKKFPLDFYSKNPFVRKAIIFLQASKTLDEPTNRSWDNWEASYYLLSHSVELAIKAVAVLKTGDAPHIHDKQELSEQFKNECSFSDDEMNTIRQLKELNNGPGGLRYDNKVMAEFLPSTFNDGVKIVERLVSDNFQS